MVSTFWNTITGDRGPRIDLPGSPGLRGEDGFQGVPGTYSYSFCYFSSGVDQHQFTIKGLYLADMKCIIPPYRPERIIWTDWGQGCYWF